MDCGLLTHIIGSCTSAEKGTKQSFLALSGQEKCFGSIQSKPAASLQYSAGYYSGSKRGVWNIWEGVLQERLHPQIWRFWWCLSENERSKDYYSGVCYSKALGSQRDGYLDPSNISLLLNPTPTLQKALDESRWHWGLIICQVGRIERWVEHFHKASGSAQCSREEQDRGIAHLCS